MHSQITPRYIAQNASRLATLRYHEVILLITCCLIPLSGGQPGSYSPPSAEAPRNINQWSCEQLNFCDDKSGFESILALHQQLDDDQSGDVDISETKGFLREELNYSNGGQERHSLFHKNDSHISVDELWHFWRISEVHNWTCEETVTWLVHAVELPQYSKSFIEKGVTGVALPRLATSQTFLIELGIKSNIHRQKIALKAMDTVLFGPPKLHNLIKDIALAISVIVAIGGCWFAYFQHRNSQIHASKMMKDLESLSKAEEDLQKMQSELERIRNEQQEVANEREQLKKRLENEAIFGPRSISGSNLTESVRIAQLEQELRIARDELERCSRLGSWAISPELQHLLQLTYEIELKNYETKKAGAEQQLFAAKEGCEKLRRKRQTFMGSLRVAHGSSIDDVDSRILQAKASLSEVTRDLQERIHRWRNIEAIIGIPIMYNATLRPVMGRSPDESHPTTVVPSVCSSSIHSEDESRDDITPRPNGTEKAFLSQNDSYKANFTVGDNDSELDPLQSSQATHYNRNQIVNNHNHHPPVSRPAVENSEMILKHRANNFNSSSAASASAGRPSMASTVVPPVASQLEYNNSSASSALPHSESCYELQSSSPSSVQDSRNSTSTSVSHLNTMGSTTELKKKRSFMTKVFNRKVK